MKRDPFCRVEMATARSPDETASTPCWADNVSTGDCDDLWEEQSLSTTFEDYGPWVSVLRLRSRAYRVIQRIG